MAIRSIAHLKSWFRNGQCPTESSFWDLIESFWHKEENLPISAIDTLSEALNDKFTRSEADQIVEKIENVSGSFQAVRDEIDSMEISITSLAEHDGLLREEMVAGDAATLAAAKEYSDQKPHVTEAEKAVWNAKQESLVSGSNIKTINGSSLLGSGNIEIEGGGGSADWRAAAQTGMSPTMGGGWCDDVRLTARGSRTVEILFTTGGAVSVWQYIYFQEGYDVGDMTALIVYIYDGRVWGSLGAMEERLSFPVTPNTTYHVQLVFSNESQVLYMYVNGIGTSLSLLASYGDYGQLMIGGSFQYIDPRNLFSGAIHLVRIYNKALGIDNPLFNEGRKVKHDPAAFAEYIPVNIVSNPDSVITSWKDSGPNGFHLKVAGSPTVSFTEPMDMDSRVINTGTFYTNLSTTVKKIITIPPGYVIEDIILFSGNFPAITLTAAYSANSGAYVRALIPPTAAYRECFISMGNDATTASAFTAFGRSTSLTGTNEVQIYTNTAITNTGGISATVMLRRIPSGLYSITDVSKLPSIPDGVLNQDGTPPPFAFRRGDVGIFYVYFTPDRLITEVGSQIKASVGLIKNIDVTGFDFWPMTDLPFYPGEQSMIEFRYEVDPASPTLYSPVWSLTLFDQDNEIIFETSFTVNIVS